MKKIFTIALLFTLSLAGFSQLQYSKVKIYATNAQLRAIGNLGVTIDHGTHKSDQWFIADLSETDIQILNDNGVAFDLLIPDVASYYAAHSNDPLTRSDRTDCPDAVGTGYTDPEVPEHFNLGSMGGYYTYEEFLAELDEMRATFPDLITEKQPISDFETWEGRPIHWVRISDNADTDEGEHEVLYTALHHAREPMSLSQTIFYMWYVLEHYGTDDEITYLVDHTEMYFVPMINPDGYKRNQTTNPSGGGMHRKNRNPSIGTSNKGVDLNRNYSYHWNESGTSPDEDSDVFAGDSAFSEPETQAIKWFCENHNFKFAFNSHAHGDLLLFPIGWADDEFAEDHDYFQTYSNHMAIYNNYIPQKATDLYPAAGDSDDWMYADDLDTKPEVFAMTPEIGNAFWPSSSAIIPTCKEMFWSNKVMSHMPHIYGVIADIEPYKIEVETGYFNYSLQRLGLQDGPIVVSMTALTGIATIGDANVHYLALMETIEDSISYTLNADIAFGDEIKYVIHTDNGLWTKHDTIIKSYGSGTAVFMDDCTDLLHWTGDWATTNETYFSPVNCITDSPYDDTYGNNVEKEIVLDEDISLEHATYAYVHFHTKWEIENDYDYVEFMISTDDGASWQPLCGKYTNAGVSPQDVGEPLYDGIQSSWVQEEIDLTDYLDEPSVRFKFILITDGGLQMDGFYFDDFTIYTDAYLIDDSGIEELTENTVKIYPNPAREALNILVSPTLEIKETRISNELGQEIRHYNGGVNQISLNDLAEGVYFISFVDGSNHVVTKRFTVMR